MFIISMFVCLVWCCTSQSTVMEMPGAVNSPNHSLFLGKLTKRLTSTSCTYFRFNLATRSKSVWSGNTTITHCRPTHGTERKSHRTFALIRHPKHYKSKATSSLFLTKMIAKLDKTQSNAYQKRQTSNPCKKWRYIKQKINNNRTALEQTAA